ncbi:MAG: hypothetical protein QF371_03960 [Flavobacteriales bacterium]|nr:hypothetical protein [Flavobacteriales bacterium]
MNRLTFFTITFYFLFCSFSTQGQTSRRVKFPSKDGVTITADMYEANPDYPWVVLFHQAQSSRGEFKYLAPKFNRLEVNCIAVDLRSGKEANFIPNETYVLAKDNGLPTEYMDAEKDMIAAIEKAYIVAGRKPVIILGSSYSASLALKLGIEMSEVKAVIAFSPGEYFGKDLSIIETVSGLRKPSFITCAANEKKWTKPIANSIWSSRKIFYVPSSGGAHGASALNKETEGQADYWIQVINFIQTVKKDN